MTCMTTDLSSPSLPAGRTPTYYSEKEIRTIFSLLPMFIVKNTSISTWTCKRFLLPASRFNFWKIHWENHQVYGVRVFTQYRCHSSKEEKVEDGGFKEGGDRARGAFESQLSGSKNQAAKVNGSDIGKDDSKQRQWKWELAWLTRALEPALQLYRWALPTGGNDQESVPSSTRSVSEIIASLQRSRADIQDWSLGDLTVALYLVYLRQASASQVEDFDGVQISSDATVLDLIYHLELADGAYEQSAAALARKSMLREQNILKFIRNSNVMRPGYYMGIDVRNKLVIFGIRGTHTIYDLITDLVSSGDQEMLEGYSTHHGSAEAARWFFHHELKSISKCMKEYEGFRLRIVGHSLGGAAGALLAILLRKSSKDALGFDPDIVSAVGFSTPPCMSKELAESCSDFVSTVVLQDDIIPRLSTASLMRLRNEILQTDWLTIFERDDLTTVTGLLGNAKQVVSSVQDAAKRCAEYAAFSKSTFGYDFPNDSDFDVEIESLDEEDVDESSPPDSTEQSTRYT